MARVLILTAFYKQEDYMQSYVGSLLGQSFKDFRVVFISDDPEMNKRLVTSQLVRLDKVQAIYHAKNLGAFATFKELTKIASESSEDYVMILEADDFLSHEFLNKTVSALDSLPPSYLAVHTDTHFFHPDGRVELCHWKTNGRYDNFGNHSPDIPEGDVFDELVKNNFIMTCAMLMKRQAFVENNDLEFFEACKFIMSDYPLYLKLARKGKIGYIDQPLSNYRVSNQGVSNNPETRGAFVEATLRIQRMAREGILC